MKITCKHDAILNIIEKTKAEFYNIGRNRAKEVIANNALDKFDPLYWERFKRVWDEQFRIEAERGFWDYVKAWQIVNG